MATTADSQSALPRSETHVFDPWLTSSGVVQAALAENIAEAARALGANRQRRFRQEDHDNAQSILAAVTDNLAYVIAVRPKLVPQMAVSFRAVKLKKTRYDRPGFKQLVGVLEALQSCGLIHLKVSKSRDEPTVVRPTGDAWHQFSYEGRRSSELVASFSRSLEAETVMLMRGWVDEVGSLHALAAEDYPDTEASSRLRAELRKINEHLHSVPLDCAWRDGFPIPTGLRTLVRRFLVPQAGGDSPLFSLDGRLSGGWWMTLSPDRRADIAIAGEAGAELRIPDAHLRLAYAHAGAAAPRDLSLGQRGASDPRWLPGLDWATRTMLFRSEPLLRLPAEAKALLPPRVSAADLSDAIRAAHPKIAHILETGIGPRLIFLESSIMTAALLAAAEQGLTLLPVDGAMLVQRSKMESAAKIMKAAALEVAGFELPVVAAAAY